MCTRWAGAGEAVDEVDAGSSMTTRVRVTLIYVILTVHPLVASLALEQRHIVRCSHSHTHTPTHPKLTIHSYVPW